MPELGLLTPIRDGQAEGLRELLRGLTGQGDGKDRSPEALESPFAELSVTHFARLVVIDIGSPHLLFTTRFDGDERRYLADFAKSASACEIYKRCKRPKRARLDQLDEQTLRAYLLHYHADRVPASYVVSAFPADATVAQINAALELRAMLSRFAVHEQGAPAVALAHRFRQERLIREQAEA
ncbi:MAG: hypothetical protein E6G34_05295 [Actinobacteria bacterium]|nr:MAG: hypothetical protein E6G34_05295 [Actinomycetota bacterium]